MSSCDSINRSPVFVSATLDNTQVQIDLDNDGVFDLVDTDGDDCPDQGTSSDASCVVIPVSWGGSCGLTGGNPGNCIYTVDAWQSLRVYDFIDYDNSGTRIVANKPVAVAYGQDTDQATGPDPIQDTGYTIYPINQLFLDPVLVVDKEASTTAVPTAGGTVTYTRDRPVLRLRRPRQPAGVRPAATRASPAPTTCPAAPSSPTPTSPRASRTRSRRSTPPPAATASTGRGPTLESPAITLGTQQILTVQYDIAIPDSSASRSPIRLLTNEGHAQAEVGGSVFSPFDTADVVQTDVVLTKSSSDDGTLSGGETVTFTLTVENIGGTDETNVVISDAIPPDTTFSDPRQHRGCRALHRHLRRGPERGGLERAGVHRRDRTLRSRVRRHRQSPRSLGHC